MAATSEFAPAKINLSLHITGQRPDGYHLLDSLVIFADVGDWVHLGDGPAGLRVSGPMAAGVPTGPENLVLRAAQVMRAAEASLTLEKHLPTTSGIGGGSTDAAATLRLFARATGRSMPDAPQLARLGSDLPVCLDPRPRRMRGVGDILADLPPLPPLSLVLCNPGIAVSTPAIFAALSHKTNAPMPDTFPHWQNLHDFTRFLKTTRNDLQPAAESTAPLVTQVIKALDAQAGCQLARMSGSGATCFGLFSEKHAAARAAEAIKRAQPTWWVAAAGLYPPAT